LPRVAERRIRLDRLPMPAKKRIHFQMIRAEYRFTEHFFPEGFTFTVWTLTR